MIPFKVKVLTQPSELSSRRNWQLWITWANAEDLTYDLTLHDEFIHMKPRPKKNSAEIDRSQIFLLECLSWNWNPFVNEQIG